jgi:hypothetical protein
MEVSIGGDSAMWRTPDGEFGLGGPLPPDEQDAWLEETAGEYALDIDGRDLSEEFERCFTSSGYTVPKVSDSEAQGSTVPVNVAQLFVEASNQWAACARDSGLPGLKDSRGVGETTDLTELGIFIPESTTIEVLRQVVEACPVFDPDKQDRINAAVSTGKEPAEAQPLLTMAFPEGAAQDPTPEDMAKYGPFWDLLYGPENAYYESVNPKEPKAD